MNPTTFSWTRGCSKSQSLEKTSIGNKHLLDRSRDLKEKWNGTPCWCQFSLREVVTMPLLNTSMQGKVCLITGANSGIGKATALGLAQMGATVVMVCRDHARGEEAQREIKMKSGNDDVDLLFADLSGGLPVQAPDTFRPRYPHLHVLINNAGAGFTQRQESVDGVEITCMNSSAPFLLTNLLLDVLKNSAPARIINVDSDNYRFVRLDMQDFAVKTSVWVPARLWPIKAGHVALYLRAGAPTARNGHYGQCPGAWPNIHHFWSEGRWPCCSNALEVRLFSLGPEKGAQTSIYLASSPEVETITGNTS